MTEEEKDIGLGNLFRNKLEENEMVAGSDLTGRFMRRLDRKEFLRFNPARFNIYYLAAAAAGLTVAGLLVFTSPRNRAEVTGDQTPQPEMTIADVNTDETDTLQTDNITPGVKETKTCLLYTSPSPRDGLLS